MNRTFIYYIRNITLTGVLITGFLILSKIVKVLQLYSLKAKLTAEELQNYSKVTNSDKVIFLLFVVLLVCFIVSSKLMNRNKDNHII